MNFFSRRSRLAVFTVAGGLIVATSIALSSVSASQASREGSDSKIDCKATGPCLWYMNNGSGDGIAGGSAGNGAGLYGIDSDSSNNGNGAGVAGVSKVQTGVYGSSQVKTGIFGTSTDLDGVFGTAAGNGAGVYGANTDSSTSGTGAGAAGVSQSQTGVYGSSGSGIGVYGISQTNHGVYGLTPNQNFAGVYGANTDNSNSGNGAGAAGVSQSQIGVYGSSVSYIGVYGVSQFDDGIYGQSGDSNFAGVYGANTDTSKSGTSAAVFGFGQSGAGVEGMSQGISAGIFQTPSTFSAIWGRADNGSGLSALNNNHTYSAIYGEADDPTGSPLFVINNATKFGFFVDSKGNGTFSGKVFASGFVLHTLTRDGDLVRAYAAKTAEETIEDTGSGSIVLGSGVVRFDPNFARVIDASRGYQVLITPDGDNRGLFVSYKSPIGFAVREAQGGRSTITFDYRVVAYPIGGDPTRLAPASIERAPLAPPRLPAATVKHPSLPPPHLRIVTVKHPPLAPHTLPRL